MATVTIYAENALDPYSRYWTIWKNGAVVAQIVTNSGYTWAIDLEPGAYEFGISCYVGTYAGNINGMTFTGLDYSNAVAFTVGVAPPPPEPYGKIIAIRVQDLETFEWFNWDNGVWDKTPEVTAGARKLYIAAYVTNEGDAGEIRLLIYNDQSMVVLDKREHVAAGATFGGETGTINMPDRNYGITVSANPGSTVKFTIIAVAPPPPPEPRGEITSIKVEDVARGVEFNWSNGAWDSTPTVAVGSKTLIIGVTFTNVGNVGGRFDMTMIDDVGTVLGQRLGVFLGAGYSTILRPYPIDMPNRAYAINYSVHP